MSKSLNAEKVSIHKKAALSKINNLLDTYINDPEHLKKANLISFWLENYISYIQREETFDPSYLKRYERGDIIKVNFGFNVGSEYGGLHYAIVLDKYNARNSPVITVIPLTSYTEGDDIHPNDVSLGNELYLKLQLKIRGLKQNLSTERQQTESLRSSIQTLLNILEPLLNEVASTDDVNKITMNDEQSSALAQAGRQLKSIQVHEDNIQKQEKIRGLKQNLSTERQQTESLRSSIQTLLNILEPLLNEVASTDDVNKITMNDEQSSALAQAGRQLKSIQVHEDNIQKQEMLLNKASSEIAKMKDGSVALPNQITTISKQRIYDPKSSYDVLSGVKLSPDGLDKLNDGLKKLFFN